MQQEIHQSSHAICEGEMQAIETDSTKQSTFIPLMQQYQQNLHQFYQCREWQDGEKWPGRMINKPISTNLALIENEKVYRSTANAFTHLTLHGNIDEIDRMKTPVTKESLFAGDTRCFVVQGAAGIGKSMFSSELAQDWVKGTRTMQKFKLVYIIHLRFPIAHKHSSLQDLLYPIPPKEVEEQILLTDGEGVLLILDGFDELPRHLQEKNSFYGRIVQGKCLRNAHVLITSRPTAAKQLERLCPPRTVNVEILGFQLQNIEAYIHEILKNEYEERAFLQYINRNLVIKNMMYIPLHTAVVVELFKMKSRTLNGHNTGVEYCNMTLTELFTDLCKCLIYRYMCSSDRSCSTTFDKLSINILPEESIQKIFNNLLLYAYNSLLKQELSFESLPADFDHMGFMRSVHLQPATVFAPLVNSYSFLHLTLQEYLAAFHIYSSQLPERWLKMAQNIPKDHQSMVLRFLAGLSKFKGLGWQKAVESMEFCPDAEGRSSCSSTLLNCIFEAQDSDACQKVFPSGLTVSYSPITSTQFDCFALGFCIANSGHGCKWKLCAIGGKELASIAAGIQSVNCNSKGRIDLIKLSYGGDEIHNLAQFPACILQELRELNLSNCGLNNESCSWLANFLPKIRSLRQLDLSDNPFSEGSTGNIFASLSQLNEFQYLDLLHAQLNEQDIVSIKYLVKKNGTLKNLIIGDRTMSPSRVELMVNVVLADSSLESISFMNIDFPRLATHLADRLKINKTLKMVMLWDRSFCRDGALKLMNALKENKTLSSMTLMPWYKKNISSHWLELPEIKNRIQWFIYPERKNK